MISTANNKSVTSERLTLKTQAIATITAIVAAVALPQIFHVLGVVSGMSQKATIFSAGRYSNNRFSRI